MAEPLKNSVPHAPNGDSAEPRTARAREARDLGGRGKRGASQSSRQRAQRERASSKSSENAPTSARKPVRSTSSSRERIVTPRSERRPRQVSAGSGARIIAPVGLAIFVVACFGVLSSSSDDSVNAPAAKSVSHSSTSSGAAVTKVSGPTKSVYKVKSGDSFALIAEKEGVDVDTLQSLNPDIDPRDLQPGQKLKLK